MLGTKRRIIRTKNNIDDIIAEYKKYDAYPFLSSFSNNSMMFYMKGRIGIWKIAPKFQVLINVESQGTTNSNDLHLCIKPPLIFHLMNVLAALLFVYIAWATFTHKASPVFLFVPLLIISLSLIENGWQQDICIKKLERVVI